MNSSMLEFLNILTDLTEMVTFKNPGDYRLQQIKTDIEIARMNNELDLFVAVAKFIYKYSRRIKRKDEAFFLMEEDYTKYTKDSKDGEKIDALISEIKSIYVHASAEEKADVWSKITGLYEHMKKFFETSYEECGVWYHTLEGEDYHEYKEKLRKIHVKEAKQRGNIKNEKGKGVQSQANKGTKGTKKRNGNVNGSNNGGPN
jgi:hypothetical protein